MIYSTRVYLLGLQTFYAGEEERVFSFGRRKEIEGR